MSPAKTHIDMNILIFRRFCISEMLTVSVHHIDWFIWGMPHPLPHTHTPMRRVREAKLLQSIHTSCPYHYDAISQGTYKACLKRDISMMICHICHIHFLLSCCHLAILHIYIVLFFLSRSFRGFTSFSPPSPRRRQLSGLPLALPAGTDKFQERDRKRTDKNGLWKFAHTRTWKSYDVCYNATTWIFGVTQKPVSGTSYKGTLRLRSFRLWWKIVSCFFVP